MQQVQDSTEQLRIRRRQSQDAAIAAVNTLAPADNTPATGYADEHATTAAGLPDEAQGLPPPTTLRRSRLLRGPVLADQQVT